MRSGLQWASSVGTVTRMITTSVLLWAVAGREDDLRYEDEALALLVDHGGRVLTRVGADDAGDDGPTEIQIIQFDSQAGLDSYMTDPRRQEMAGRRYQCVARMEMQDVSVVWPGDPSES